jgi:hypothetical protein
MDWEEDNDYDEEFINVEDMTDQGLPRADLVHKHNAMSATQSLTFMNYCGEGFLDLEDTHTMMDIAAGIYLLGVLYCPNPTPEAMVQVMELDQFESSLAKKGNSEML